MRGIVTPAIAVVFVLFAGADVAAQTTQCRYTYGITPLLLASDTRIVGSAAAWSTFFMITEPVEGAGPCTWSVTTEPDSSVFYIDVSLLGEGYLTGDRNLDVAIRQNGASPRKGKIRVLWGSGFFSDYEAVQAGAIRCGEVRSGTMTSGTPLPVYDFVGTAGNVVMLKGHGTLYAPDGTSVSSIAGTWPRSAGWQIYRLPQTGTYTTIASVGADSRFELGLQFASGGTCNTPITCGSITSGSLTTVNEIDAYRFTATAGESVIIPVDKSAGGAWLTDSVLFDPAGDPVAYTAAFYNYKTYRLSTTGAYTLLITAVDAAGFGNYDVFAEFLGRRCSTSITCGQLLSSRATKGIHTFAFDGTAGRSVGVFVPTGWPWTRDVEVFGPDGALLPRIGNTNMLGSGHSGHYLPATTGVYTAVVNTMELGADRRVGLTCQGLCTYFVESNAQTFPPEGGRASTVVVTGVTSLESFAPDNSCCWTSQSHVPWVRFISGASACRTWAPAYEVDPFVGIGNRTGTMTIAGQTYTVTQSGVPLQPTQLVGTVSGTRLTLSWTAPVENTPVTYVIEIGTLPGSSDVGTIATASSATTFVVESVPPAVYYIRVRARTSSGSGIASNEITVTVNAPTAPGAPTQLRAAVSGTSVTLTWLPPTTGGVPTMYEIEGGMAPGAALAVIPTGSTLTTYVASGLPTATIYARVRAVTAAGRGPASNEVSFTVNPSGCTAAPAAPTDLTHAFDNGVVTLTWTAPSTVNAATQYRIEVGSSAALANLVVFDTPSAATTFSAVAPPGIYFVRVRGINACGVSAATSDLTVAVQ